MRTEVALRERWYWAMRFFGCSADGGHGYTAFSGKASGHCEPGKPKYTDVDCDVFIIYYSNAYFDNNKSRNAAT